MKRVSTRSVAGSATAVDIDDGRHRWRADAEATDGGDDLEPSPYALLLSALGACMSITARQYAARKGWPLTAVSIDLTHERPLPREYASATSDEIALAGSNGRIDVITASVRFDGALSQAQTARLFAITQRCPVHRTLAPGAKIVATLAGVAAPTR